MRIIQTTTTMSSTTTMVGSATTMMTIPFSMGTPTMRTAATTVTCPFARVTSRCAPSIGSSCRACWPGLAHFGPRLLSLSLIRPTDGPVARRLARSNLAEARHRRPPSREAIGHSTSTTPTPLLGPLYFGDRRPRPPTAPHCPPLSVIRCTSSRPSPRARRGRRAAAPAAPTAAAAPKAATAGISSKSASFAARSRPGRAARWWPTTRVAAATAWTTTSLSDVAHRAGGCRASSSSSRCVPTRGLHSAIIAEACTSVVSPLPRYGLRVRARMPSFGTRVSRDLFKHGEQRFRRALVSFGRSRFVRSLPFGCKKRVVSRTARIGRRGRRQGAALLCALVTTRWSAEDASAAARVVVVVVGERHRRTARPRRRRRARRWPLRRAAVTRGGARDLRPRRGRDGRARVVVGRPTVGHVAPPALAHRRGAGGYAWHLRNELVGPGKSSASVRKAWVVARSGDPRWW